MEWVETTAKTVDEARELALDQLGVEASDAEFETLEEPKSGLFGRTRGTARVRARIAPRVPRPKTERKRRTRKGGQGSADGETSKDGGGSSGGRQRSAADDGNRGGGRSKGGQQERGAESAAPRQRSNDQQTSDKREVMDQQEQIDVLEGFLVELAQSFGLEVSASSTFEDNQLTVDLSGDGLGLLVGPRLATLDAIQEVARHALQRQAAGREYAKVVVDVAGIRSRRQQALTEFVTAAAATASNDGVDVVFEVMSSVDRKQVHDVASTLDGVSSSSEGEDPRRRVVLRRD